MQDNTEAHYPEHEKLEKVKEQSQTIGEFLEWMNEEKGIVACRWHEMQTESKDDPDGPSSINPSGKITYTEPARYLPANYNIQMLLAEYFEIDLDVIEQEKRAMLAALTSDSISEDTQRVVRTAERAKAKILEDCMDFVKEEKNDRESEDGGEQPD